MLRYIFWRVCIKLSKRRKSCNALLQKVMVIFQTVSVIWAVMNHIFVNAMYSSLCCKSFQSSWASVIEDFFSILYDEISYTSIDHVTSRSNNVMVFCYSIVMVPIKRFLQGWSQALVLLATVVITDPRTAWNCLEPVSMSMKSYDVTLRYSIHVLFTSR